MNFSAHKWRHIAKSLLKSEIKKRDITYEQLSLKLQSIGIEESPENINNKINRGAFSATFFLQCLSAIEVQKIDISIIREQNI